MVNVVEILQNQRKAAFSEKVKTILLKWKYKSKFKSNGVVRVLGKLPVLKLPGVSKIVLGSKVVLNSDFKKSNTALTYRCTLVCGFNGVIEIGDNTMLNGVSITAYQKVLIGRNCQISSSTLIADTDFHPLSSKAREKQLLGYKIDHDEVKTQEVIIGNNVWIGWGSTILKGVRIGDNSVIAAGSVVLSDIPSNVLAAGNPAVVKKNL
jgi:acetyltransferase-like isoleucine patch superfamily enzyme